MEVPTTSGKDKVKNTVSFTAKLLKEILSANSEITTPTNLYVSESELASVAFDGGGFKSQYHLVKTDTED